MPTPTSNTIQHNASGTGLEAVSHGKHAPAEDGGDLVVLTGVGRTFMEGEKRHPVLRDVSLRVPEGRFVAILGRSGSGKSTLLNLVAGIDDPDAGEIVVDGTNITRLSERDRTLFRRRHIGFVYQFFNLIPTLTVLENVRLPLELAGRGSSAASRAAMALLDEVSLADRADTYPDKLSGGEQQRVAIARALAADPRLVLADEPTGNLDVDTGEKVLAMLLRLTRDRGRTLLMATHSRTVAARADRVLRVEGDHVVELAPDAVLSGGDD
jgi:putative ABC transport system ATP-binding protein